MRMVTAADIGQGEFNPEVIIYLDKGVNAAQFNNKKIMVGETISLNNIMFDLGKAELKNESKIELDKVVAFMQANKNAEIELSGHTSSKGDANYNRSLSYKRVKACKDYILKQGIDARRIIAIGYGPDKPVAPNDTEANRAKTGGWKCVSLNYSIPIFRISNSYLPLPIRRDNIHGPGNGYKKAFTVSQLLETNERHVFTSRSCKAVSPYFYKLSDNALPGLNFATFFAAICKAAPVLGLRPVLASLFETENDPKPTISTRFPAARAPATVS
jgi:hypothetical protein